MFFLFIVILKVNKQLNNALFKWVGNNIDFS